MSHFTAILDGSHHRRGDLAPLRVHRAKRYMETCCRERTRITVEDVARHVGCARSTLRASWREEEDRDSRTPTPSAYLQWCYVEAAKLLLENKSLAVEQIADSVGCSRGALYTAFERFEHMPPGEYRRRHRRSRSAPTFPHDAVAT